MKFRTRLLYGLTRNVVLWLARLGSRAFIRARLVKETAVIKYSSAVQVKSLYRPGYALRVTGV